MEELFADSDRYTSLLGEAAEYLTVAIYNVCMLFRPQKLILTGRAMELEAFSNAVLGGLNLDSGSVRVDLEVSAAFGAAAESMKSAIKKFDI